MLNLVIKLPGTALFRSIINMLKLSKKSDKTEFLLYMKLTIIGLAAVGAIAFIIKILLDVLFLSLFGGA
jgi:protein translocase SEC61 complex gamma subunit